MSQISFLSDQYKQLAATSDKINNSVIALKKRNLLKEDNAKYPHLKISKDEINEASSTLIPFLENVSNALNGNIEESDFLPTLIFEDYKNRLSSNQYLEEDIKELIEKLKSDSEMESKNILILDDLLSVLDIERSALFRKLRTARG
jgi:recombinational DNA repair ATPase RecF